MERSDEGYRLRIDALEARIDKLNADLARAAADAATWKSKADELARGVVWQDDRARIEYTLRNTTTGETLIPVVEDKEMARQRMEDLNEPWPTAPAMDHYELVKRVVIMGDWEPA